MTSVKSWRSAVQASKLSDILLFLFEKTNSNNAKKVWGRISRSTYYSSLRSITSVSLMYCWRRGIPVYGSVITLKFTCGNTPGTAQVSDNSKLFFVTSFWGILMFAKLETVDITVRLTIQKWALNSFFLSFKKMSGHLNKNGKKLDQDAYGAFHLFINANCIQSRIFQMGHSYPKKRVPTYLLTYLFVRTAWNFKKVIPNQ